MDLNEVTKLIRDSLMAVEAIKNEVEGHIYSSYIDQESKFPCITNHIMKKSDFVKGAGDVVVQCRIWTSNDKNPSRILEKTFGLIYDNFYSNFVENDILNLWINMDKNRGSIEQDPFQKEIYSLPFNLYCKFDFKE